MTRDTLHSQIRAIVAVIGFGMLTMLGEVGPTFAQDNPEHATRGDVMEDRKATSRKSIQWWDSSFQVDPDSLFAPGYINNQEPLAAGGGEKGVTLDELKAIVASNHSAFPGMKVDIKMQVAEGGRVATHWTFTGVQKGTYEGLAPTNKAVSWTGISIDEFDADGKIARTWVVWDQYTLFRQLGLIK